MIVCHCFRVSDRQIRSAVGEGACDLASVARACRAGAGCGGCRAKVAEVVSCELGGEQPVSIGRSSLLPILRTG